MARLGPAGKMRRLLEFLLGLRDDRVLLALREHGFGAAEREQGWGLMQALGMTQAIPAPTAATPGVMAALDAWRNEWLRVLRVSLAQSFPQVHAQLFRGIERAGQDSISVVPTFLVRFEKLQSQNDATSRAAVAKLRSRGFTPERQQEARQLLESLRRCELPNRPDPAVRRATTHKAEAALWEYYVEWSQIARAAIKDVRLLGLLGFRGGSGSDADDGEAPMASRPAEVSKPTTSKRRTRTRSTGRKARKAV
jgi:hypothetical protein